MELRMSTASSNTRLPLAPNIPTSHPKLKQELRTTDEQGSTQIYTLAAKYASRYLAHGTVNSLAKNGRLLKGWNLSCGQYRVSYLTILTRTSQAMKI